jgi:multidrug efflux pump subunit AcrB
VPLAIASGADANARLSMGTAVIGGLLVATLITLFITLTFYVAAERLLDGQKEGRRGSARPAE